ncbi:MAG: hypothetical protein EPO52_11915 [Herbiconiux sp.]|uniref:hypothetical protein n=1 Tax=Herbiconiux sp. TaxID=1871186 RepID=UPI0012185C49|nr:hypothetical protein [Herbiconiux sp.]TAJ47562.1 MAG: hypothetical protein EPO52_11915 [Herbiconiux sp.]
MKTCTQCNESKSLEEFNAKRAARDAHQNVCRDCNRASARRYYALNREAHIRVILARTAAQRRANLELIGRHLVEHPCVDCGEADLRVLDFDHRDATQKAAEVMILAKNGYSLRRVIDEIAKCDVRCRNCHAKVTYERMGANWRSAFIASTLG